MIQYRSIQTMLGSRTNPGTPSDHSTTAQSVSGTNVYYSLVNFASGAAPQVSLHLHTSGTPTGTFSIQQSNDPKIADTSSVAPVGAYATAQSDGTSWAEIASVAVTAGAITGAPPGSPNDLMVSIQNGSCFTRVVYTNASGSGSVIAWFYGV